jgi:DNA mismatch endonuclease (patch repair protein)
MRGNRGIDTAPELALRQAVHARGLRYRKHVAPIAGLRCKADLVFSRARVAVFVDGCFWHRCPDHGELPKANRDWWKAKLARTWDRDRANDLALQAAGWTSVRVWEHEDPDEGAARVARAVAESLPALRIATISV